ncbi:CPBP family intramembrane glutamic endopeptidase [Halorientalis pallida]|uniref:CPBP family intramembrane metalloprotease n=1 Tax=Halorientalis pallida TaxID=2479928 RepID=A0A498KY05_9EURY|nr:type II CAAX endopeptidase family protein [Halorientalis pallida]RXK50118.1 CPBP family intramembrane metalloprotease [Halorientalis pallida]
MADERGPDEGMSDPDDATPNEEERAGRDPEPDEPTAAGADGRGVVGLVVSAFWNRRERRLRLLWRFAIGAGLLVFANLVVGSLLIATLGGIGGVVGQSLFFVTVLIALPTASYLVGRRPLDALGLDVDRQWLRDAGFGLALGVVLPTLLAGVTFLTGWLRVTGTLVRDADAGIAFGALSTPVSLLAVALFFLGVAVSEELLVRGYLLTNLAESLGGFERIGRRRAILLATLATAALFGLLHATNPNASVISITNITLFGILLGLAYVWTDRLGVAIGLHLAWNTVVGGVYGLPVSGITVGATVLATETTGPALLTGGAFGPEGGLLVLLALVVGTGLTAWWVRRAYGDLTLRESVAVPTLRE